MIFSLLNASGEIRVLIGQQVLPPNLYMPVSSISIKLFMSDPVPRTG